MEEVELWSGLGSYMSLQISQRSQHLVIAGSLSDDVLSRHWQSTHPRSSFRCYFNRKWWNFSILLLCYSLLMRCPC